MDKVKIKEVIKKIKDLNIVSAFEDEKELKLWLKHLSDKQVNNFLNLNIDTSTIEIPLSVLLNLDLLDCNDCNKKVNAILKLKNGDGCWPLFEELCTPEFLHSQNFYKDIEMLSKASTARYALWVIGKKTFINSPYHDEDLKLIVNAHDTCDDPLDFVVADALATVAGNKNSINSQYHLDDMKLISESGRHCLQTRYSYPKNSINNLAIKEVSLSDKYHLENMQILSKHPVAFEFLYSVMTNPNKINGKNYRDEVAALDNAKNRNIARAMYCYIVNDNSSSMGIHKLYSEVENYFPENANLIFENVVAGFNTPNYIENLNSINEIPAEFAMHYVSLLMNSKLFNSPFFKSDLELLKSVKDINILMDLYRYINCSVSLENPFHESDMKLLSETIDIKIRKLLFEKVTNEYSLKSPNREYDLKYISKIDMENINEKIINKIRYYLFAQKGINAKKHIEYLELLKKGILVEEKDIDLNTLESELTEDTFPIPTNTNNKENSFKRILSLFKNNEERK